MNRPDQTIEKITPMLKEAIACRLRETELVYQMDEILADGLPEKERQHVEGICREIRIRGGAVGARSGRCAPHG